MHLALRSIPWIFEETSKMSENGALTQYMREPVSSAPQEGLLDMKTGRR